MLSQQVVSKQWLFWFGVRPPKPDSSLQMQVGFTLWTSGISSANCLQRTTGQCGFTKGLKLTQNWACSVKRPAKHKDVLITHYSALLFTKTPQEQWLIPSARDFLHWCSIIDADVFEGKHVRLETAASTAGMHLLVTSKCFKQKQQSFCICLWRS